MHLIEGRSDLLIRHTMSIIVQTVFRSRLFESVAYSFLSKLSESLFEYKNNGREFNDDEEVASTFFSSQS